MSFRKYRGVSNEAFRRLAHLPTLLLLVGYPVYWFELFFSKNHYGQTSLLAFILFATGSILHILQAKSLKETESVDSELAKQKLTTKVLWICGILAGFFILTCVFLASLLPPHLIQESDAMNYHITLPRQHLILHSFQHLPWAADDLFLLPIQFALAPFWLATELPNKFPQFLFFIGLILVAVNLMGWWSSKKIQSVLMVTFAILGSHHLGIQMGTAMLDIVICYLFLAAIDSILQKNVGLATVEFTFFFWSKSLIPIQALLLIVLMVSLFFIMRKLGWKIIKMGFSDTTEDFLQRINTQFFKKFILGFFLLSIAVGGPFVVKSLYYSGTPLFPVAPGLFKINREIDYDSTWWHSLKQASEIWTNEQARDQYGHGRSPMALMKHFWFIAVPEKGVNNAFDYPVGLPYLIVLGPFIYLFWLALHRREFVVIPWLIVISWFLWWEGTQQTRYLYIPTTLMFIMVLSQIKDYSKILVGAMTVALFLNALSVFRAHRHDLGRVPLAVLREKDQMLVKMNKEYILKNRSDVVNIDFHDAAFAQFPVRVVRESLPHTLALE